MFFHDADMCFQKWQSCSSCHPGEARSDSLNWDLLNDGMGNPKNSKNLMMAHKTPPAMISGIRPRAEVAVRAGIKYIQFAVRPEEDAVALDEYLKSLEPVPSPYLEKGELSKAAKRGQKLFDEAGCQYCHPAPLYTDMKMHQVHTGAGLDEGREWDTPTLIETWRTAPLLHDGRSATMKEVLTKHNPDDAHGHTAKMTEEEIEDLAEYVLSL
jgi:cytochrome c peroxidase